MGFQRFKARLWKSAKTAYKKLDIYATDLTLTFEGEDKHTTYIGATLTVLIMVFMIIYAIMQLEVMFKKQRTTVNLKSAYEDLTKHYDNVSMSDYGFDFAFQIRSGGSYYLNTSLVKVELVNVNSWWETDANGVTKRLKTNNYMDLKLCDDYNGPKEDVERLGIDTGYYCPTERDYTIGGTYFSPNYRYFQLNVYKCSTAGNTNCGTATEIDNYIEDAQVTLAYKNFYFDSDEYSGSPIKDFIDDKYWYKLMSDREKNADIFVRRNEVSLQDEYLQLFGEEEKDFISISHAIGFHDTMHSWWQRNLAIYFRMDNQVDTYERQIYSSGDLLAQVGGIYSFLRVIGAVLVFMFSERLLVSALAGKLYQVYDNNKDNNDPDNMQKLDRSSSKLNASSNKIFDSSAIGDDESKFFTSNPVRNLFKSTMYCRNKAGNVAKKLKDNKELDDVDRLQIKKLIMNRRRFNYNTCHVFEYIICCVACRQRRNRKRWKSHLLYKKAEDKVTEQLDIVNILRWIEQLKLITKVLLNHKQKFWLKFQKEHLLEIDQNSDVEKKRLKMESKQEEKDFIRGIEKNDPKSIEKVTKMLQNLQYGNRTSIEQKIIQGLFEEYCSDSDEEDKANRAMNTEEEKEEFYSLAMPEPYTKKKEFNKKNDDEVHDLTKLKSLYSNDQSLLFLGSSNKGKKATISKNKTLHSKISNVMRNTPLEEIANMKGKRAQSKFSKKQAKTESYKKLITQKSRIDNQQDSFKFGNKKPREGEESVTDYEGIIDALANQGENEDFPKMEELSNISERKKEDAKKSSQPKVGFETQSPPPPGSAVLDITEDLNSSNLIEEGGNRGLKQKNIFGR